jgi:peptidoglycan/LPS O-acetylase OafA/YrhL
MSDLSYRPQIDGLRALAVAGVLYSHLYNEYSHLADYSVRLFFVISGYLITGILLRCKSSIDQGKLSAKQAFRSFYARRGLRIYPAFYAVLFIAFAVNFQGIRRTFVFHALFLSNILFAIKGQYTPWATVHFWSLSAEEQFYLAWPLVIIFTPERFLKAVILGTAALGLGYRVFAVLIGATEFFRLYLTPASLDPLAAGALLALFRTRGSWPRWLVPVSWVSAIVYVVPLLKWTPPAVLHELFITVSNLTLMGLVAMASKGINGVCGRILSSAPMLYLGRISYGIYLYHIFVMAVILHIAPRWGAPSQRGLPLLAIDTVLTLAIATLSWYCLEQPFNRLKHKFPYSGQASQSE